MPELADLQGWFKDVLLAGATTSLAPVRGSNRVPPAVRVGVYVNGYRTRLVECLVKEFPILRKLVGYHSGPDNFVIVTHRPNLIEAFGEQLADMREGEAAVFEPDFTGAGYRVVARFQASDWDLLVQAARAEELSRAPRKAERHTD